MQRFLLFLFSLVAIISACKKVDKTPPVIVVLDPDYRVALGGTYREQGAIATDKEDGVLDSSLIMIDATGFGSDSIGFYLVQYYVSDAAGNEDSTTRTVAVYARTVDYAGSWSVRDSCDSVLTNYSVTMDVDPLDSTRLLVSNWRNRGTTYTVPLQIFGKLGNAISVNDTLPDFTYVGNTVLLYGNLDQFAFDLTFDEIDTVSVLSCTSQYRKP